MSKEKKYIFIANELSLWKRKSLKRNIFLNLTWILISCCNFLNFGKTFPFINLKYESPSTPFNSSIVKFSNGLCLHWSKTVIEDSVIDMSKLTISIFAPQYHRKTMCHVAGNALHKSSVLVITNDAE